MRRTNGSKQAFSKFDAAPRKFSVILRKFFPKYLDPLPAFDHNSHEVEIPRFNSRKIEKRDSPDDDEVNSEKIIDLQLNKT